MPHTSNRRRQPRTERTLPIEVRFGREPLIGASANTSADGVYFVAKGPVTVMVRVIENGKPSIATGRLVRLQSTDASGDEVGIAVRFDSPGPFNKG